MKKILYIIETKKLFLCRSCCDSIGITLYLSIFIIKVSSKLLPKELNPNYYLKFDIPGIEILIAVIVITFIGWLSLSFLGKNNRNYK